MVQPAVMYQTQITALAGTVLKASVDMWDISSIAKAGSTHWEDKELL